MLCNTASFIFTVILCSTCAHASLGVNYGTLGNNLPSPDQVVNLVKSTTITRVKLYNADPSVLHAFANTGISVVVGVPNEQLQSLTNPTAAAIWVKQSIAAFEPQTKIVGIAVGNEVLTTNNGTYSYLLMPAINNIYSALVSLGLQQSIQVSTPHSFAVLSTSYPPSSGAFRSDYLNVIRPLLDFLTKTRSTLMMNAYPYFAYHNDPSHVSLDYALFRTNSGIMDSHTRLRYTNLFDAQVDATYAAMQRLGYQDVAVSVSETGWPSKGGYDEPAANLKNALDYNRNLLSHVSSNVGTPMNPNASVDVYIFALYNENLKPGPVSEKNYGLFNVDGSAVYDLGILTSSNSNNSNSNSNPPAPSSNPITHIWCIAKPNADDSVLLKGINFACGEGSADCLPIQRGGGCYNPATFNSHASYAFNAYYQKHGRNFWNCYFSGAGMLTITDPSYGSCKYSAT